MSLFPRIKYYEPKIKMKVLSLGLTEVQSLARKRWGKSLKQYFSNFNGHESPEDLVKLQGLIQ